MKSALKGISRSHTLAGTARPVRLPVSWEMLWAGKSLAPSWGSGGSVLWLCLGMAYFFIMRSDEVFAGAAGVVHAAHCLTRSDVAFFAGESQLDILRWHRADRVEVRFRGHKGDQGQAGSVIVRTRSAVRGPRSGLGTGGGAVALMVDLLSRYPALPERAPLASYRSDNGVRVWGYGQAMRALREIVAQSGRNPDEFALHSLRIGGASVLAAGGDVPERVIQREGRWKSDAYKVYTRNNVEDAGQVSRKLAVAGKGQRQPGQGTIWGKP